MPVKTLSLDGTWKLIDSEAMKGEAQDFFSPAASTSSWMDTAVPGDVHQTLVKTKRIEDPYFGLNNEKCRWTSSRDWWYRRDFKTAKSFKGEKVELVFDGIDTYSTVWLNGKKIGETSNMFKQYRFNVTDALNYNGNNTLAVCVQGTLPIIEAKDSSKYFACFYVPRIFARKAQCQFSWDWAPFLPSIGIWLNVRLESQTDNKINDVQVRTRNNGDVAMHIMLDQRRQVHVDELDMKKAAAAKKKAEAEKKDQLVIEITDGKKKHKASMDVGGRKNFINLNIPNPKLWWPNGYGDPNLYSYTVKLMRGTKEIHSVQGRFGFREVELIEDPVNEHRTTFYFKINGVKVFGQGANKVPNDCFPGTITKESYARLIQLTKDANMNMIRLWGGGMYEKDEFYELCDENGIMVWHDLMFACSDIPDDDPNFITAVLDEFVYQIKRLRNHPSIVYWCGCNEKTGMHGEKIAYGDKVYHYIGRGVVNDLMPDVPYRPASPHSFSDQGNNPHSGDTHAACWEDAYVEGMESFRKYVKKIKPVFHSEFGFHGPCQLTSLKKFMPADQMWPLNETWMEHIHDNPYNSLEETFMEVQKVAGERLFQKIDSVNDFVKVAGTLHAEIVRAEYENDRQNKFENAGSMTWMLNDCWPSASWSVIDYYGIPKEVFYFIKRALAPVMVSIREAEGKVQVFVTSDLLQDIKGTITFAHQDVNGKASFTKTAKVKVPANTATVVLEIKGKDIKKLANSYLCAKFESKEATSQTTYFHNLWKAIEWPTPNLKCKVVSNKKVGQENVLTIELAAEKYARTVYLSTPKDEQVIYSDNFFDMVPGEVKQVTLRSAKEIKPKSVKLNDWTTVWE